MAESKIQGGIINLLKWLKAWTVKLITSNKGGAPDTVSCLPITKETADRLFEKNKVIGLFVAIEVKDTGKKASPLQLAQIRLIRKAGGIAFVSDNEKEAQRILSEILNI